MNKELLKYSLTGQDMIKLNKDTLLMVYTDLYKFDDLKVLFDSYDKIIILYLLQSKNSGHWICLFKNKEGYNLFDSFGAPADFILDLLTKKQRNELNQKTDYLYKLCKKYDIKHNKIIYQNKNTNVCGCFVSHRLHNYHLNNFEYLNIYIKNNIKNADLFVAKYCHKLLNN